MLLNDIIKDDLFENNNVEFKAKLDRKNKLGWLKTITGFANGKGGILFLGVEDKSTKLIGYEKEEIDSEKNFFFHEIKEHIDITLDINTEIFSYIINGSKRYILKIVVLESKIKPIILKYDGLPLIFMRRDGITNPATTEEIIYMSKNYSAPKFDVDETYIDFDFNNFKKLQSFYNEKTNQILTEKILGSISFYSSNKKIYKGSELFMDNYSGNKTKIVCSLYRGITRGDDEIISSNEFCGNLIDSLNFALDYIDLKTNHGFIKQDTKRINTSAYPKRSIFEALVNALAHRDYMLDGTQINVDVFYNRLVITSPGAFYNFGEIIKTYNLSSIISRRRNELICNVFDLCNVMEAKGTGFEKIEEDYSNEDELHKPFIFSKNNQFSIVLPDLTCDLGVSLDDDAVILIKEIVNQSKYDIKILTYCYNKKRSVNEITAHLGISNSTFFRKEILGNLIQQGFIKEDKISNMKVYITNNEYIEIK